MEINKKKNINFFTFSVIYTLFILKSKINTFKIIICIPISIHSYIKFYIIFQ